jgi:hypothetical protein
MKAATQQDPLGRLVEKLAKPRPYVRSRNRDPIAFRPAGYFANCHSEEEIWEENQLAKVSVIRPPADLE